MADRIDRTIIKLEADRSNQQLLRSIATLRGRLADLKDEERKLERARRTGADVTDDFVRVIRQQEQARRDLITAQRDYRSEVEGTAQAERDAARIAGQVAQQRAQIQQADLAGDVESRGRAITGAVGALGGDVGARVERIANIGPELLGAAEGFQKLRQELPEFIQGLGLGQNALANLGVAAAGIAAIGIAAAIALRNIADAASDAKIATAAQISAIQEYNQLVVTGTREDLIAAQQNALERNRIARQTQEDLLAIQAIQQNAIDGSGDVSAATLEVFTRIAQRLPDEFANIDFGEEELTAALDAAQTEITATGALFGLLTQGISSGATAANDLAAQEELSTERRVQGLEEVARAQVEADNLIRTSSSDSVNERLEAIASEQQALTTLQEALRADGLDPDRVRELDDELFLLNRETERLTNTVLPAIQAREAETEAIERQQAAIELLKNKRDDATAAAEAEGAAIVDVVGDALAQTAETLAKRERAATEAQADALLKRTRALEDHYADLADADAKFYAKRGDVLRDIASDLADIDADRLNELEEHNRDSQRASRDHLRTLERIRRDSERDETDAASRMDASAILDIRRQRAQAIEDAQDQYTEEQEIRGEDFQQRLEELDDLKRERQQDGRAQLTELDRQHRDEQQRRVAAFALKQRREDEDRRITLQRQQAAWMREDAARRAHLAAQLGVTETHFDQMLILAQSGMAQFRQAIFKELSVTDPTQKGSTYINPKAPRPFKAFANGGFAAAGTTALVGERGPEFVRFMQPAQVYPNGSGGGGLSVQSLAINIHDARDPERVAQAVRAELLELLA